MSPYRRDFDENEYMYWYKVHNKIKKEFDSEPVYNEKYLKTTIESYKRKINANFDGGKIPKEDFPCICLSLILIDF